MARKTVLVSDQSGKAIEEGRGALVRVTYRDARRGAYEADLTEEEAEALRTSVRARSVARRGRRPKAT